MFDELYEKVLAPGPIFGLRVLKVDWVDDCVDEWIWKLAVKRRMAVLDTCLFYFGACVLVRAARTPKHEQAIPSNSSYMRFHGSLFTVSIRPPDRERSGRHIPFPASAVPHPKAAKVSHCRPAMWTVPWLVQFPHVPQYTSHLARSEGLANHDAAAACPHSKHLPHFRRPWYVV